jgi:hypothetical protein
MTDGSVLPIVLGVTAIGSLALVGIAAIALFRRQSLSYFLVTLAIGTLLLRTFLGGVVLGGLVSSHVHHFVEHVLDALLIGFVFTAVYAARRVEPELKTTAR